MPAHTTIDAVVFDMDGVLTDTETIWDEVRQDLAAADGLTWPAEASEAMLGMSTPEWSAYLVAEVGLHGTPAEVADRVVDEMARRYHEHLPVLPGAVEAVERLAARWPLGLASSSPRRLIDSVLGELGLTGHFRATVSTEEVARGKPAPDGYQRACELVGVDPARAVAIEDSANGIRSAAAAGMVVVAVPRAEYPPADDALALAAVQVRSLDEVTVPFVEGLTAR